MSAPSVESTAALLRSVERHASAVLDLAQTVCMIPAPTFAEEQRAGFVRDQFAAQGLESWIDVVGNRAVGSHRYRITVEGPGGHSWEAFGAASAIQVLGDLM